MQLAARRAVGTIMKTVIAVGQMTATGDRARNLEVCGQLVQQAKTRWVDFFCMADWVGEWFWMDVLCVSRSFCTNCFFISHTISHTHACSGASMLFLPECFSFVGSKWLETVAAGEPLTGPCISHMAALAKEHKLWLSLGGFNERPEGEMDKVYNSHVIIDDQGVTRAVYRKIHLFDVVRFFSVALVRHFVCLVSNDNIGVVADAY